jgi:hypothetical protein
MILREWPFPNLISSVKCPSQRAQSKLSCETGRLIPVLTSSHVKETPFPKVDAMMDKFMYTVLRTSE